VNDREVYSVELALQPLARAGRVAARAEANALLDQSAGEAFPDDDTLLTGLAGWAFAHGFASLWLTGDLQHRLGDDPITAPRAVVPRLFPPVPAEG